MCDYEYKRRRQGKPCPLLYAELDEAGLGLSHEIESILLFIESHSQLILSLLYLSGRQLTQ